MRKHRSKHDGPMVGRFTLSLKFPIRDGGDARDAGKVLDAVIDAAKAAGVYPTDFVGVFETGARPLADEIRLEKQRQKREGDRG